MKKNIIKIAVLSFYSGHINRGVERWTDEMSKSWSKEHKVFVCQSRATGASEYNQIIISSNIYWRAFTPFWSKMLYVDYWSVKVAIFTIKSLVKLHRENIDIFIPTNGGWQTRIVRLYTWIMQSKMAVVGHAGIGWDDLNNAWSFPDVFVALSTSAQEWVKKVNPFLRNVVYVPDGVDLKMFSPKGKKLKVNLDHPLILSVGALTKSKRHELAIRAVAKIKHASLLIVGKGEDFRSLEKLGTQLLKGRFKISNFAFSKMPEVYRTADVFTIPSGRHYAFEMVIIESLACNIPVVVNNDHIRKEIIGKSGVTVNPEDTEAYAKALTSVLEARWGNRPRRRATRFDIREVSKKYEKVFNLLIQ